MSDDMREKVDQLARALAKAQVDESWYPYVCPFCDEPDDPTKYHAPDCVFVWAVDYDAALQVDQ